MFRAHEIVCMCAKPKPTSADDAESHWPLGGVARRCDVFNIMPPYTYTYICVIMCDVKLSRFRPCYSLPLYPLPSSYNSI